MSRERFDPVIEDLERELRDALAVEPSPAFERRVLARIAAQHGPAARWPFALAAAAACVLAAALGWVFSGPARVDGPVPAAARATADVRLPVEQKPPTIAGPAADDESGLERRLRFSPSPALPRLRAPETQPVEIIVPPDRARGIARLLALSRSGAVDDEMLEPVAPAEAPATLEIAPLVLPSILPQPVDAGAPERHAGRE
jgi:hypothetical protein